MDKHNIATVDLIAIRADGRRVPVALRVSAPEHVPTGEWQCAVRLDGLFDRLVPAHGEDSLQALCLALGLAATLLRRFKDDGGRVLDATEIEDAVAETDWPLEAYFGWFGTLDTPAT